MSEPDIMDNVYPPINLRAETMSEASRMIQIARAASPGQDRISTISKPRSGTISPVSAQYIALPRSGMTSPPGSSSATSQRQMTASPVSAHRPVRPPPENSPKIESPSKKRPQVNQRAPSDTYPKISPRPAPHIASTMKPSAEKKSKQQAFSNCMPGLEKLANSRANKHIESRPRSSTLVDLTSGMIPYPERVLMTTPCLRLDMAPGEDSDDSAESPENTRKEKVTKADKASPTKPTLDRLPSLGFSIYPTPQKGPGADMLPTKNSKKMGAGAGPQRRTETEMSSMKHNDTTTEIKEKGTAEKLPTRNITSETISDHKDSFRSKPNLKVDTPLENFSKTDTDAEKALPEEPEPVNSSPPGPPNGFLSSQMRRPREIGFVFLVCMLQLIPQAALTICFPISSTIAHTFHIQQPSVLPWMAAAYATTFGTFILISGRLGDIFGHKKLVIVGFIMMTPSSVVAGISPWVSPILFFVARAMQGVAASLMVPNGLALLGRTYAPGSKMKIIAFSLFGCCAPLGAYLGMLLAAIFVDFIGWQFVFFLLAGISLLCAITSKIVFIPPPPTPSQMKPFKEMLGDMDWLGAVTGVAGMICVQVAFVSAPSVGWGTSWIYMLLIIGALLIAGFVVVEIRVAEHPLIPFRMLRSDVAFVLAAVSCGWAVFGIWSWYLWRYLLNIRHYTPLESAVHILPIVPAALFASILTAYLMRTTKPAYILLYATLAATLGPLLLYFAAPTQTYWGCTFVSLLMMPIFMDFCLPAATYIMSNFFPMHMQGVSGSLVATVLNYSISLGLGLATTAEVYTSVGPNVQLAGIQSAWLTGVGIGGLGVFICAIYLFKSVLSHHAPARPLTIRELEVASMLQVDSEDDRDVPSYQSSQPNYPSRPSLSLLKKPSRASIATSFGRNLTRKSSSATNRHRFSGTALGFSALARGRRTSTASVESSLFPLTQNSSIRSTSTTRPAAENVLPRDTLTTALPAWRDRMMPQYVQVQIEGPPRPGSGMGGASRYQKAQRVNVSQQDRFLQGRRG